MINLPTFGTGLRIEREEEQMIPDAKGEDGRTIKCRRWLNRGFVKSDRWV